MPERENAPQPLSLAILLGGPGVEGGIDGPGEPATTWRTSEGLGRVEPTGFGLGFFQDPVPLIEHAGASGVDEVFLRISWARINPREGVIDTLALDQYGEIIRLLVAQGLKVSLVLSDGTAPNWFGGEGWLLPSSPERFAQYSSAVALALGSDIDGVVTFEEPASWALQSWLTGRVPPFRLFSAADVMAGLDAMLSAHCLAKRSWSESFPNIAVSYIHSPPVRGLDLEALVLGHSAATPLARMLERWVPGRAKREAEGPQGDLIVVVGQWPRSSLRARDLLQSAAQDSVTALSASQFIDLANVRSDRDSLSVLLRHVAAIVDRNGRHLQLQGHRRIHELNALRGELVSGASGSGAKRLIVGELTDRWQSGSYRVREGFLGVDRTRGAHGVSLLATDSSGVGAFAELREFARVVNHR